MPPIKELTGKRFGRLQVLSFIELRNHRAIWSCICDCGISREVPGKRLLNGMTKSCGCLKVETGKTVNLLHGQSRSPFYFVWKNMLTRCYKSEHYKYLSYGARGIYVCAEWHDLETFIQWCEKENPPAGYQIERCENDGPYAPWNCKFASRKEQQGNTRRNVWIEYQGQKYLKGDFIEKFAVVSWRTVYRRCKAGMDFFEASFKPSRVNQYDDPKLR